VPEYTADIDATGTLRILTRSRHRHPDALLSASTSELYGKVRETRRARQRRFIHDLRTASRNFMRMDRGNYREAFNLHASNGILFNHESPRRVKISLPEKSPWPRSPSKREKKTACTSELDSKRDWGYAPDYVKAMWLMLQQDTADDYVIEPARTIRCGNSRKSVCLP